MQLKLKWPDSVPSDQIDLPFIQGMLDRMAFGYHNYGHMRRKLDRPDNIKNIQIRLKEYKKTGNTEFLMDAANFAMMEFAVPSHPDAFFKPTGSDASPGAIVAGKHIRHRPDKPERREVKRREGD